MCKICLNSLLSVLFLFASAMTDMCCHNDTVGAAQASCMLQNIQTAITVTEGSSDSNSLARFMIGGLWVSYRMTYGGKSSAKHVSWRMQ